MPIVPLVPIGFAGQIRKRGLNAAWLSERAVAQRENPLPDGSGGAMPDLPSASEITKLTSLLAPGLIILGVRYRFRDASPPGLSEKVFSYAIASVAYSAAANPIFHVHGGLPLPSWLWQLSFNILAPLIVGAFLAYVDQSEQFYRLTELAGLRPVHHTPTAWDFTFRKRTPTFVLVHLMDGSEVAGAWVDGSFASSTAADRDVYIDQMWRVEDGGWQLIDPPRSILICGGSIRMIEFIKGGSG